MAKNASSAAAQTVPPLFLGENKSVLAIANAAGSKWIDDARQLIATLDTPSRITDVTQGVITGANMALERVIYAPANDTLEAFDAVRRRNYYRRPVIAVSPEDGAIISDDALCIQHPLQDIFSDQLGLAPPRDLIAPRDRDDIERIGTSHDFLAMMFWAHIKALYWEQHPRTADGRWPVSARFDEMARRQPADVMQHLAIVKRTQGHLIHGLRAQDSDSRWAYYCIHVAPANEQRFLEAIRGDGIVDLEAFGVIVLSEYESSFRERRSACVRARLDRIVASYAELAQRERGYSYPSGDIRHAGPISEFERRRWNAALENEGSRRALVEQLAHSIGEEHHTVAADHELPLLTDLTYGRRLQAMAADIALGVIRRRKLPLDFLASFANLIVHDDSHQVARTERMMDALRDSFRYVGSDRDAFAKFFLLVCQNESLVEPNQYFAALKLITVNQRKVEAAHGLGIIPTIGALVGLTALGPVGAALGAFAGKRLHGDRKKEPESALSEDALHTLRNSAALLDALMRVGPTRAPKLLSAVQRYCLSSDKDRGAIEEISMLVSLIADCALENKQIFEGSEAIEKAGLRIEMNALRRITELSLSPEIDDVERLFLQRLLQSDFMVEIRAISILGHAIESKPHSEKRTILKELLGSSLQRAFDAAEYPADQREAMVGRIIDALLSHDKDVDVATPEMRSTEVRSRAASLRDSLPKVAPAIWKDEKKKKDTPVDFVKRHYGPWLRADATGLTRPDIRRLDYSLYMALSNWLRNNELPEDCPLPVKSEAVAREEQEFEALGIDESAVVRTAWRRRDRARGQRDR